MLVSAVRSSLALFAAALLAALALCGGGHARAATLGTVRVSQGPYGLQGDGPSGSAAVSANARYVVFSSGATNLVPGDTNGHNDIFVSDLNLGRTVRITSMASDVHCVRPAISGDGQTIAFVAYGGAMGSGQVYACSLSGSNLRLVSANSAGVAGTDLSDSPSLSSDGRYIAFTSCAPNLDPKDTNGSVPDVFVRDMVAGATAMVSLSTAGAAANDMSGYASISGDGRYVAFSTNATNLIDGVDAPRGCVCVRDRQTGITELVSATPAGAVCSGFAAEPSISSDGRYVAFTSNATDLVTGLTDGTWRVFVRDRQACTTVCASVSGTSQPADGTSMVARISADGRHVAFQSRATNLVPKDTNYAWDVFVRDLDAGITERVSVASDGTQGDYASTMPAIAADGRAVAFESTANTMVPLDTNGVTDVFLRTRWSCGASVTIAPVDACYLDTALVKAVVVNLSDGSPRANLGMDFTIDGVWRGMATTDAAGQALLYLAIALPMATGEHIVDVAYYEGAAPAPCTASGILTVSKTPTTMSVISCFGEIGGTAYLRACVLTGNLMGAANRTVSFEVDGVAVGSVLTSAFGDAWLPYAIPMTGPLALATGVHNVRATFDASADTMFLGCDAEKAALTVLPAGTGVSLYAVSGRLGATVQLKAVLKSHGLPVVGRTLYFSVDGGVAITAITDAAGIASAPYSIPPGASIGAHSVRATFLPYPLTDPVYRTCTNAGSVLTVLPGVVGLSLYASSGKVGQTIGLRTLVLCGGQPVIGETITFAVDGAPVGSSTSGANGAGCLWTIPAGAALGAHKLTVSFAGSATHLAASRTGAVITVK